MKKIIARLAQTHHRPVPPTAPPTKISQERLHELFPALFPPTSATVMAPPIPPIKLGKIPHDTKTLFQKLANGSIHPNAIIEGTRQTVTAYFMEALNQDFHAETTDKKTLFSRIALVLKYGGDIQKGHPSGNYYLNLLKQKSTPTAEIIKQSIPGLNPTQKHKLIQMLTNHEDAHTMDYTNTIGFFSSDIEFYRTIAYALLKETAPQSMISSLEKSEHIMATLAALDHVEDLEVKKEIEKQLQTLSEKECVELGDFGTCGEGEDRGHYIDCALSKTKKGEFRITLCNRGLRPETEKDVYIHYEFKTAKKTAEILIALRKKKRTETSIDALYAYVRDQATTQGPKESLTASPQKTGNCGWASLTAGLKYVIYHHDSLHRTTLQHTLYKSLKRKLMEKINADTTIEEKLYLANYKESKLRRATFKSELKRQTAHCIALITGKGLLELVDIVDHIFPAIETALDIRILESPQNRHSMMRHVLKNLDTLLEALKESERKETDKSEQNRIIQIRNIIVHIYNTSLELTRLKSEKLNTIAFGSACENIQRDIQNVKESCNQLRDAKRIVTNMKESLFQIPEFQRDHDEEIVAALEPHIEKWLGLLDTDKSIKQFVSTAARHHLKSVLIHLHHTRYNKKETAVYRLIVSLDDTTEMPLRGILVPKIAELKETCSGLKALRKALNEIENALTPHSEILKKTTDFQIALQKITGDIQATPEIHKRKKETQIAYDRLTTIREKIKTEIGICRDLDDLFHTTLITLHQTLRELRLI